MGGRPQRAAFSLSGLCPSLISDDAAIDDLELSIALGRDAQIVGHYQEGGVHLAIEATHELEDI
jgi:hypothetical protein